MWSGSINLLQFDKNLLTYWTKKESLFFTKKGEILEKCYQITTITEISNKIFVNSIFIFKLQTRMYLYFPMCDDSYLFSPAVREKFMRMLIN